MLLQMISVLVLMISAALCAPDGVLQNMVRLDSSSCSQSSGTLDPIGGVNLVRVVDPYKKEQLFRSLEIGKVKKGGVKQSMMRLARDNNSSQRLQSSGTLDSIGGGYILRSVDPYKKEQLFGLLEIGKMEKDGEGQNGMRFVREDKPQQTPDPQEPSHTLDSIGGGNLLGVVDPYRKEQIFRSLDARERRKAGEKQNVMSLARDVKPKQPSRTSYTLDPIGGGNLLGIKDPNRKEQLFRSLELTQMDNVDDWTSGESNRNFDEIDNVGFVEWAHQSPPRQNKHKSQYPRGTRN